MCNCEAITSPGLRHGANLPSGSRWSLGKKQEDKTMNAAAGKRIKNKGGRPELKIKRNTSINVRLTSLERILIEGKAKQARLSPTDSFRKAAKRAKVHPRITPEDMKVLHVLAGATGSASRGRNASYFITTAILPVV